MDKKTEELSLYKYMSFPQFISMIEFKQLYLTKISLWEDTYEGYDGVKRLEVLLDSIVKSTMQNPIKQIANLVLNSTYAQSWTYQSQESDALWKEYSEDGLGVRIKMKKSYIEKRIKETLKDNGYKEDLLSHYYIEYTNEFEEDDNKSISNIKNRQKYIGKKKRKAFEHEKEYRFSFYIPVELNKHIEKYQRENKEIENDEALVYEIKKLYKFLKDIQGENDIFTYDIELNTIEEILLDPRSPKWHKDTFMKYCENRDFHNLKINYGQSKLLEKPDLLT
jgi:hypothetical protein